MPIPELLIQVADPFMASKAQPEHVLAVLSACAAGLLVIVSAFVRTMIPLRWLAVGSNVGFIVYGLLQPVPLMVVLHAVLLPVNVVRVVQMVRLTRRVRPLSASRPDVRRDRVLRARPKAHQHGALCHAQHRVLD